jgi:hypothetical protein
MVALKQFSAAGVAITDEYIRCAEAITVGETTYYRGYLANTVNNSIADGGADYGVWTDSDKGGTRKTAMISGYPSDATAVRIETREGWVIATEAMNVYICYLAHEPVRHSISEEQFVWPGLLPTSTEMTFGRLGPVEHCKKFCYAIIETLGGGRPSADSIIYFSNLTSLETVSAVLKSDADSYKTEFDAPFKILPGETMTVNTNNGRNAFDLRIRIKDV